jgi:hypothetical protein
MDPGDGYDFLFPLLDNLKFTHYSPEKYGKGQGVKVQGFFILNLASSFFHFARMVRHALIEPEKGVADKTGNAGFQPCLADGLQVV